VGTERKEARGFQPYFLRAMNLYPCIPVRSSCHCWWTLNPKPNCSRHLSHWITVIWTTWVVHSTHMMNTRCWFCWTHCRRKRRGKIQLLASRSVCFLKEPWESGSSSVCHSQRQGTITLDPTFGSFTLLESVGFFGESV
jgi:hypothetical protein